MTSEMVTGTVKHLETASFKIIYPIGYWKSN